MKKTASLQTLSILLASFFFPSAHSLKAQANFDVSTAAELSNALSQAYSDTINNNWTDTISIQGNISSTSQMFVNANVNIVGNEHILDMNNADRAFFIAGGTVDISGLTIQNGLAQGGNAGDGGGAGAGMGGAIFVANGQLISGSGVTNPTSVVLDGIYFTSNQAIGGSAAVSIHGGGGGGGMGGNGGSSYVLAGAEGGGGGGGFGVGADGGSSGNYPGASGAFLGGASGGSSQSGASGGTNGGGGGGSDGLVIDSEGGGGGVGGQKITNSSSSAGANGGFGGGGAGTLAPSYHFAGNGGFGGGGGANAPNSIPPEAGSAGGNGGFGGGGGMGAQGTDSQAGLGGFGAGNASWYDGGTGSEILQGGGGLGAGGAVFVMAGAALTVQGGSFLSNSVAPGTGYINGSAYGADLFLGSDVTFSVTNGSSLTVNSLGGAGNTSDPNVAQAQTDSNAQGGLVKTGGGTLTMTGNSYYTGATTLHQGTVTLGAGALEQGTAQVIVGQNNGDNATLNLGSSSTLNVFYGTNPAVILGQNAGSAGTVVIGSGTGSGGAFVGANVFQGGVGGGRVVFSQNNAAGDASPSVYPFLTALTGNLQVVQDGPGTTLLQPLAGYGSNTFTGGVVVDQGTLQLGNDTAFPDGNTITLNGGSFDLDGHAVRTVGLSMNGGTLTNSAGTQTLTSPAVEADSGVIAADLTADQFVKNGQGTTTITNEAGVFIGRRDSLTNTAFINSGTLVVAGSSLSFTGPSLIVGQQSGSATLVLEDTPSALANINGSQVILGADAGSRGTLILFANNGIPGVTGGAGGGQVIFQGGFMFIQSLTGNLQVVQDGAGETDLLPQNGDYTFTGGLVVNQGTLGLSKFANTETGLPSGCSVILNGGVFNLGGNSPSAGVLTLNGGTLTNTAGSQGITTASVVANSGLIAAPITGTGGFTQQGAGTTTITSTTSFTGATTVQQGNLAVLISGALGGTTNLTVATGGTFTLGASNAVNVTASLFLQGGTVRTGSNLSQTLGNWTLQYTSTLDFAGNAVGFSFSGLSINGSLAIWNWNALNDSIGITGAYSGDLSQISFFSDSGLTQIGTGAIVNNQLQAVPEPSTIVLFGLGSLLLVVTARARWRRTS